MARPSGVGWQRQSGGGGGHVGIDGIGLGSGRRWWAVEVNERQKVRVGRSRRTRLEM